MQSLYSYSHHPSVLSSIVVSVGVVVFGITIIYPLFYIGRNLSRCRITAHKKVQQPYSNRDGRNVLR